MRCTSASTLDPETLAGLFNEGFSEYVVPVRLSEDAFREHIANNDMIEGNDRAIALYEKLGFQLERDLIVWLLAPQERRAPEFEAAAADVLLAAANGKELRFHNAPADDPSSRALAELGAHPRVRQHELCLRLG